MSSTAIWIIVAIVLFILGNLFGLRLNPREKALGQLREQARKLGLQPRLVPMPDWVRQAHPDARAHSGLVAYYHLIVPNGQLPWIQATVTAGQLHLQRGHLEWQGHSFVLDGAYAIELQANSAGVYWDESRDLSGQHLTALRDQLLALAQQAAA